MVRPPKQSGGNGYFVVIIITVTVIVIIVTIWLYQFKFTQESFQCVTVGAFDPLTTTILFGLMDTLSPLRSSVCWSVCVLKMYFRNQSFGSAENRMQSRK